MLSAEPYPDLPAHRRTIAGPARSPRPRFVGLMKLAAAGGLAFAVGTLAMSAMHCLGWGAGLLASVSGPVLIATTVERLYPA